MSSGRPTAVVIAPGRGSYTAAEQGALRRHDADPELRDLAQGWIATFDAERESAGLPLLRDLDQPPFRPATHLKGENASALIYATSFLDSLALRAHFDIVGVGGNSLGWYSALGVAGALPPEHAHRLIQTMARLQAGVAGGQILYPRIDESTWLPDAELEAALEGTLHAVRASHGDEALARSIELGGYAVLAGTEAGIQAALATLPPLERGAKKYPLRLAMHGPFHTSLLREVSARALEELAELPWSAPELPLVDGRGFLWSPWSADPQALCEYTLGHQVTETFDYSATVRVLLREFAPDVVILLGPGNPLGGPTAQVLLREGWRGMRTRADFDAVQKSERKALVSYGLEAERARVALLPR
ncbi:MAG: ACP S-malonyltransferase [Planctomycetes bacterium]|nr:ACP S-malonyltransferase [Planctomycetota bacterium]